MVNMRSDTVGFESFWNYIDLHIIYIYIYWDSSTPSEGLVRDLIKRRDNLGGDWHPGREGAQRSIRYIFTSHISVFLAFQPGSRGKSFEKTSASSKRFGLGSGYPVDASERCGNKMGWCKVEKLGVMSEAPAKWRLGWIASAFQHCRTNTCTMNLVLKIWWTLIFPSFMSRWRWFSPHQWIKMTIE